MLDSILGAVGKVGGWFADREQSRHTNNMSKDLAQQNMAMQREFAQHGIQWRVEDAKRAGIHPIYALGGSGASFSPVSANFTGGTSAADSLGAAGQDIGRAFNATSTQSQRVNAFTAATQKLSLERAGLENEILRADLASKTGRLRQVAQPPMPAAKDPYLVPGQTQSGLVKSKPLDVAPGPANQPQSEGGAITDVGYARTKTGWTPVPSKDVKERIEDNFVQERLWDMRNNLLPSIGINTSPPPFKAPPGKAWYFDVPRQEYQLKDKETPWYRRGFDVRISE